MPAGRGLEEDATPAMMVSIEGQITQPAAIIAPYSAEAIDARLQPAAPLHMHWPRLALIYHAADVAFFSPPVLILYFQAAAVSSPPFRHADLMPPP